MPPPKYLKSDYFGAMDRPNYFTTLDQQAPLTNTVPANADYGIESGLTTWELGTTLNPMQGQLQALQAKIREGASKVEFEFSGKGKGNSQATTPETYGKEEREMMRRIAHLNDIKSSTHATFNVSGLAGFTQRGFDKRAQQESIQEVQRAIDFAKDATTGGAIVVHTGEWERPVSTYYGKDEDEHKFSMYEDEDKKARLFVVDRDTGELVSGISKDRTVVIPKWMTAKDLEEDHHRTYVGQGVDVHGNPVEIHPDDYVDMFGRKIDINEPEELFRRVPRYSHKDGDVKFDTEVLTWDQLEERRDQFNQRTGQELSTEEYFAQTQLDNQILQAKGSSLYHLQRYQDSLDRFEDARKAYEFYSKLQEDLPQDEREQLQIQTETMLSRLGIAPKKNENIPDLLKNMMEQEELSMRHTHQASSSADVQAREQIERRARLATIEDYGLEQTGKALARLAEEAMDKSKAARAMRDDDERFEDLYIAPENWHPGSYGSHPDELLNIVKSGREEFKERLREHRGITNEQELDTLAKKHIKTTFDIGHLNMWRSMMERKQHESEEEFQQRFNDWVFTHLEELDKEEAIGHLHLTDNFGYNDEHLSLGQGNTPVKEFVEWMQKRGHTDFIIEPGSFNAQTIMQDAWSYLGAAPQRKMHTPGGFQQTRMQHAGFYQPPNFVTRSYIPINDFSLWSDVPLE